MASKPLPPGVNGHTLWGDLLTVVSRALTDFLHEGWRTFVAGLTQSMPQIATLGIVICGACLMLTGDARKWLGRAAWIFWIAACWMVLN